MGRRSYAFLASRWPQRTGALADELNSIAKYVVSATLEEAGLSNTTIINDDPVVPITRLKQEVGGTIVVPASFRLVDTLFAHDLVDELRIMVFPVVLGTGGSLFSETSDQLSLRLHTSRHLGDHLIQSTYPVLEHRARLARSLQGVQGRGLCSTSRGTKSARKWLSWSLSVESARRHVEILGA
jgi:dihydrofolate reductase